MARLKAGAPVSSSVVTFREIIPKHLPPTGSYEFMENAQAFLKPYAKKFMAKTQCRNLIHETGVRTFPRPPGIPDNWIIQISDKGAGMEYIHPVNEYLRVRVMPGKPHSPHPYQQQPYIVQMKDGKAIAKAGTLVDKKAPEAHIPVNEFNFQ